MSAGAGNGLEVSALFARYQLDLVRLALVLVDDRTTAEDVVQDVFTRFVRHAGRLRDPDAALAYLRTATVNTARSALRRRRTEREYLRRADAIPATVAEPADLSTMRAVDQDQVMRAVRGMAPRDQEVLALRYWSDLSDAEIAQTLGISPSTVRSTLSRALDKLERLLKDEQR